MTRLSIKQFLLTLRPYSTNMENMSSASGAEDIFIHKCCSSANKLRMLLQLGKDLFNPKC